MGGRPIHPGAAPLAIASYFTRRDEGGDPRAAIRSPPFAREISGCEQYDVGEAAPTPRVH